ncbi:hypothetical protein HAX54_027777 [Datura stramonium]|uniref:Uncharacterized protein n=1 Tax=Datura stramonium TaxID=4076 RepID=A0ABS8S903_DATST|nr:hypothetical protein [Datura stramonium]
MASDSSYDSYRRSACAKQNNSHSPAHTTVQHLDGQTDAHVESSLDSEGDSHTENGSDGGNSSDDDCDNPAEYHSQEAMESPEVTEPVLVSNPQVIHLEVDQSK